MLLSGVKANRFYIFTHPRIKGAIEDHMHDILAERAPQHRSPPE